MDEHNSVDFYRQKQEELNQYFPEDHKLNFDEFKDGNLTNLKFVDIKNSIGII